MTDLNKIQKFKLEQPGEFDILSIRKGLSTRGGHSLKKYEAFISLLFISVALCRIS